MFHFLLLIFIPFISFIVSSTILCSNKRQQKIDGKTTASMDDPPSKKCNTKGGLLADDPDLKSLKLKTREQQEKGGGHQSTVSTPGKPSTQEGTDLKSFDDKRKHKERLQTAEQPLEERAMSVYANKTGAAQQDGMSIFAMEKVDKKKLPPKMPPKASEEVPQDLTQTDESHKNVSSRKKQENVACKTATSMHGAKTKKCNTKTGLPAEIPDLKPSELKAKEQQKGGAQQSTIKSPGTKFGSKERAKSAYTNKTGVPVNQGGGVGAEQDGMSITGKVEKEKAPTAPTKLGSKDPEEAPQDQDSTQADESHKSNKNLKSKFHTPNKNNSSKRVQKTQHGADGKTKKNLEGL